jgi:hypothetical protein
MKIKYVIKRCLEAVVVIMALCCLNGCMPVLFAVYCLPYNTYHRLHEKKVDFSGRLIDQNGQPVAQAKVQYCIQGYGLAKPAPRRKFGEVVSNDDGFFDIHEGRGCELFIKKVEKRGYELGHNKKYNFGGINIHLGENEVAKAPVVFHLRKKHNEAVFLLKKETDIGFKDDQAEKWLVRDMVKGWTRTSEDKSRMKAYDDENKDLFWDYEATGENHPEKQEWTVHIKVNGENAGIQAGDAMLYEAPADGYEKEIALTFKYSGGNSYSPTTFYGNKELVELYKTYPKFLYLRLRNPGMYARFCLDHAYVSEKKIHLRFKVVVNPYGSRSLEPLLTIYDKKHNADVTNKEYERFRELFNCREEAEKAMKEQRLAPRPPFEQWIKEGKAIY